MIRMPISVEACLQPSIRRYEPRSPLQRRTQKPDAGTRTFLKCRTIWLAYSGHRRTLHVPVNHSMASERQSSPIGRVSQAVEYTVGVRNASPAIVDAMEIGGRARVVCHEAMCPNRRCPCLEVTDLPDGVRVNTFPDSTPGEPGADLRPSFTTFVGKPAGRMASMPHAIGVNWKLIFWPNRRAAIHGHEVVVGRLLHGQPIDDLGV
jgi:hypothetical protein